MWANSITLGRDASPGAVAIRLPSMSVFVVRPRGRISPASRRLTRRGTQKAYASEARPESLASTSQNFQQGGLPCAVLTQQGMGFAISDTVIRTASDASAVSTDAAALALRFLNEKSHGMLQAAFFAPSITTHACVSPDFKIESAISEMRQLSWKLGEARWPFTMARTKSWHSMIFVSP